MKAALLRILALTKKELLAVLKDPRGRATLFIPPIVQCFIFGYAATFDLNNVPYAVLDESGGQSSRELVARLDGTGVFRKVANITVPAEAEAYINSRRALLVIHFPEDFERRILKGMSADVQIIADGRNSNTAGTALGYVGGIVDDFNRELRDSRIHMPPVTPLVMVTRAWYNPNLETRWNMIPGMIATLTLLQTLLLTAMSVAREREQGTFDQLLVTPFRPVEIMAGKALPSIIVGTVQATTILCVAQLWFHIPFAGSFLVLYLGLGLFLLAAVGIGLLISSIAATMQQALLYSFVFLMPFALLSGLTTPISSMPQAVQYLTLINPLRYAIAIVHSVYLEAAGVERLLPDLWPLVVLAIITLSTASWMFRHKVA